MQAKALGQAIVDSLTDPDLFARFFQPAETWEPWKTVIRVLFGMGLLPDEMALFHESTGRTQTFDGPLTEAWLLCGRRSGKSRVLALIAVCLATFKDYGQYLAPGERGVVMVLAVDKTQADVIFSYAKALIEQVPMLAALIENTTSDTVDLTNRVSVEVHTSSHKSVRGRTLVAALCDEAAFWRSEDSRNPAVAVLAALRPGLSTIPGAPLLVATSTYAQEGAVYEAFSKHHGQDASPVLCWRAPTLTMNPSFRRDVVTAALEADRISASAEYGSEFMTDLRAFLDEQVIQDCLDHGCKERPASPRHQYLAFVDMSGGRRDSMTLAIGHKGGEQSFIDAVREHRPLPGQAALDPAIVVADMAKVLKSYQVTKVKGDNYAGEWPVSVFRAHGIKYEACERARSDIYLDTGPLLAQGIVRLIDVPRLTSQLRQLNRRAGPSGRDRVSKPTGGHDDVANAVMGGLWMLTAVKSAKPGQANRSRPEYSLT